MECCYHYSYYYSGPMIFIVIIIIIINNIITISIIIYYLLMIMIIINPPNHQPSTVELSFVSHRFISSRPWNIDWNWNSAPWSCFKLKKTSNPMGGSENWLYHVYIYIPHIYIYIYTSYIYIHLIYIYIYTSYIYIYIHLIYICMYIYIYIPHIYPLNCYLNGDDNPEGMALGLYTTLQKDSQDVYLGCLVCFLSFAASHTHKPKFYLVN